MARYGLIHAPFPRRIACPQRRREEKEEGGCLYTAAAAVAVCCRSCSGGREGRQAAVGVQRAEAQAG